MRTPTLVVAIILAMAMAGDSANIERLLHQLRLLAGEETIDEASMTHTKGKSVDTEETQLLDLVKKLSLESKEPEPIDVSGEKSPDVEQNYDMAGLGDQNPTSEEGEAEGDEVTEQNYDQSETGEEYSTSTEDGSEQAPDFGQNYDMTGFQNQDPTSEGVEEEGSTDVEQNYDVAKIGEKDSTLKEDEQAPDVGQNYGMTGREDQDPTSKEVGGEKGPDVEQKYDMTGREDPDQSLREIKNHVIYLDVRDVADADTGNQISFRIFSSNRWTDWFEIPGSFSRGTTKTADIGPAFFGNFGTPDKIELKTSGTDWLALNEIRLYNGYTHETTHFRCNCELSTDSGDSANAVQSKIIERYNGL